MAAGAIDLALQRRDPSLQLGNRQRIQVDAGQRRQAIRGAEGGIILFHHGMQR